MNAIVKEVLKLIEQSGFDAYLVGGYPRDLLLGRESFDYDICTSAKKEDLESIFNTKLLDNYGSIILKYKNIKLEITTYRKELNYKDIRTPIFIYTDKLSEDILRRDFTINTICMNWKEEIVDILAGQEDIKNKIIRSVGNPNEKINEDPLRILRAIRLESVLKFNIEESLKQAILKYNYKVKELSYFRKKQELDKIFDSGGIQLLKKYQLLSFLEIEYNEIVDVSSYLGIWAQIKYSNNYEFSKVEQKKIAIIRRIIEKHNINNYDLYLYDIEVLKIAADILKINDLYYRYEQLPIKNRGDIDISYDDIINNTKLFPSLVYEFLEQAILNNELVNKRCNILEYIKNLKINNIDK